MRRSFFNWFCWKISQFDQKFTNFSKLKNPMISLKVLTLMESNTAHMIRKGPLSEENIPAYKQFMALAG